MNAVRAKVLWKIRQVSGEALKSYKELTKALVIHDTRHDIKIPAGQFSHVQMS